jgi:hypothetical protein
MLIPFFRTPAEMQRSNQIYLSVPFEPARPDRLLPPQPAASSTATYEQH